MFSLYRNILVVHKKNHDGAAALAKRIRDWLREKGMEARIAASQEDYSMENVDCVIVLGGDGTILGVARRAVGRDIPIFGINFGKVGFLATASPHDWESSLMKVLRGEMPVRECLSLRWELRKSGRIIRSGVAANDLVLSRESLARLVSAHVFINDEDMGIMRSDGIILTTPLGSSGYNISAGGPLLYAGLDAIGLTPICPFMTGISPLVFPAETRFDLRITRASAECFITVDGQEGWRLEEGDDILARGWEKSLKFITDDARFFARMRMRGFSLEKD